MARMMGSDVFGMDITGLEEVTQETNNWASTFSREAIPAALEAVASQLTVSLQKHIQEDVYDAYTTKDYPRREEQGGLLDPRFISTSVSGQRLIFDYSPSGTHTATMDETKRSMSFEGYALNELADYDTWSKQPIKPHPVHGDQLINRIQTGRGFDWDLTNAPEVTNGRPFWNKFLSEAKGETVAHAFTIGFRAKTKMNDFTLFPHEIEWGSFESELEGQAFADSNFYIPDAYGGLDAVLYDGNDPLDF